MNADTPRTGFLRRLAGGLARTASKLGDGLANLSKQPLDTATLQQLEDLLIEADLGVDTAGKVAAAMKKHRSDRALGNEEIRGLVAGEIENVLRPVEQPFTIDPAKKPFVVLGRRRERLGQDDDHRQARRAAQSRRQVRDAGRRRHVPRGRDRATPIVGQARRRRGSRARTGRRSRRRRLRGAGTREIRRRRRLARRYRRAAAEQAGADGRAREDRPRPEEAGRKRAACDAAGVGRHRRPERALAGRDLPRGRRHHRPRDRQARRHRQGRHPGGAWPASSACRCTSSASARRSRI